MMQASSKSWKARLTKFRALSRSDKLLLFGCVPVVAATRLGLTLLSYRTLRRWVPDRAGARLASDDEVRRLAWGVRHAARIVPGASCLTQALAAQFLLARSGRRSQIQVGVAQGSGGQVVAHAWLISNGHVVIGGSQRELQRYKFLAELDPGIQ
jgi:hypothetical protein